MYSKSNVNPGPVPPQLSTLVQSVTCMNCAYIFHCRADLTQVEAMFSLEPGSSLTRTKYYFRGREPGRFWSRAGRGYQLAVNFAHVQGLTVYGACHASSVLPPYMGGDRSCRCLKDTWEAIEAVDVCRIQRLSYESSNFSTVVLCHWVAT